ncbi:hypothetical protein D3C86_2011080 [compost metagenome]
MHEEDPVRDWQAASQPALQFGTVGMTTIGIDLADLRSDRDLLALDLYGRRSTGE